ncbi:MULTISPECIES: phosphatidate cytidylyltransferase [Alteribacter]|uniref:Phosphatidate cytidylyltransferase n=1 Tax=Alteribacter keqinensis TaxID=2483800 RepID=A0A3M7TWB9_9BACI|nr:MULTISPECIES: phosphatidate cytidylyltransferase [Alteribacter]MBM7094208.1 phosphatidate cytidylyltransferase [Alteribacter salitolerans]RNA69559.1 phosphatidate cytidylyltransferase [Alteribacter keqinensis]
MKQRIITGVVAGAGFLAVILVGGLPFTFLIFLLATIAMAEILKMKGMSPFSYRGAIGFIFMWLLLLPENILNFDLIHLERTETFLLMIIVLLALTVISKNAFTFDEAGFIILSSVYIGFGFHYFLAARFLEDGLIFLFFVLILVWVTDSGAYFCGRFLGKHKLWPHISPKKTIEGSLGGIAFAILFGFIYSFFFPVYDSMLITLLFILVVSVSGQLGDLVESALKRHYSVKDSGQVLPGHGGILDRFDSLIFVMPILYLLSFIQ